jgi:GTPase SAR1 family protein
MLRFAENEFKGIYNNTIGVDFKLKKISIGKI